MYFGGKQTYEPAARRARGRDPIPLALLHSHDHSTPPGYQRPSCSGLPHVHACHKAGDGFGAQPRCISSRAGLDTEKGARCGRGGRGRFRLSYMPTVPCRPRPLAWRPVPQTTTSCIQQTITRASGDLRSTVPHDDGRSGRIEAVSIEVTRGFEFRGCHDRRDCAVLWRWESRLAHDTGEVRIRNSDDVRLAGVRVTPGRHIPVSVD